MSFWGIVLGYLVNMLLGDLHTVIVEPILNVVQAKGWLASDKYSVLSQYCEDLTEQVENGEIGDFVGREDIMKSMMSILASDSKCPCIVGDTGVGKNAMVEGLAYRIVNNKVPENLKNKKIYKVNIISLVAGNNYSSGSSVMSRVRALLEKAKNDPDIILFIDDASQIVKFGLADQFKSYLECKNVKIIFAADYQQYSYIGSNSNLTLDFTKINLASPDKRGTLDILKYLKSGWEQKYEVVITDEAINSVLELTDRYMKSRTYPDKAIEILKSSILIAKKRIVEKNDATFVLPHVMRTDVEAAISQATNIPIGEIGPEEAKYLKNMSKRINRFIFGQHEVINELCSAVFRCRAGLCNHNKPRASFLLTGLSGVGKTRLASCLGREIGSFISIDMARYSSPNSLDSFICSQKNDIHNELITQISEKPYSVVLFDNIEKANKDVINLILGVLDKGYFLESNGKKVDFTDSIIIFSTNACANFMYNELQTTGQVPSADVIINKAREMLGDDLLNKVDKTMVMNPLKNEHFKGIVSLLLGRLESKFIKQNVAVSFDDNVRDYIANTEIDHHVGARVLERKVIEKIEAPMAKMIIEGQVKSGDCVNCTLNEGRVVFANQDGIILSFNNDLA